MDTIPSLTCSEKVGAISSGTTFEPAQGGTRSPSNTHHTSLIGSTLSAASFKRVWAPLWRYSLGALSPQQHLQNAQACDKAHAVPHVQRAYGRLGSHLLEMSSTADHYVTERQTSSTFWMSRPCHLLRQLSDTVELLRKDRHSDRDYGPRQYIAKGFSCDWHPTRQQRNIAK